MASLEPADERTLADWRDILGRWQIVLADRAMSQKWVDNEEDATGLYVAEYSRDSDGPPVVVRKEKKRYLSPGDSEASGPRSQMRANVASRTTIKLAPYPIQIQGREQLTILFPGVGGSLASEASYSFDLQSVSTSPEIAGAGPEMARKLEESSLLFTWTAPPRRDEPATVNLEGITIQQQMADLETLATEGMIGTATELKVLDKTIALLRKDDSAVDELMSRLAQNPKATPTLVGALGAAGTAKAQQALVSIVAAEDWPMDQRRMGLFSFVQVTEPVPELDDWLRQLHQKSDDLSNGSLLILGAMGDRVREQDPERFKAISQYVVGAANAPGLELQEKIVGLDAIGNLGPAEVPPFVEEPWRARTNYSGAELSLVWSESPMQLRQT